MSPHHPVRFPLRSLLLLLAIAAGCSGLRIGRVIIPRADDWATFGRTPLRTGTVNSRIDVPLTLAWEYDLSAGTANGALVVTDSIVLAGTMRGELHAVRLSDGKKLGWVSLGDAIEGTPVVTGSTIFVPLSNSRESVVSFDLTEGHVKWKQTCGDLTTSLLLTGQHLYGGTAAGTFFCLETATGGLRWEFTLPDNAARKGIRSSPAAWRSLVVFGADDGWCYALEAETGTVRWKVRADAPIVAPPVADSSLLIVATIRGTVLALDPSTGTQRWKKNVGAPVYGHVLLSGSVGVVATAGGTVTCLAAQNGEQKWTTEVGGPVLAGPAAADGIVFLGTLRREFLALSLADGKVLWKTSTEGRIKTSPVISSGLVIVTTDDRSMLAFRGGPQL